jgi:3-deoxy-D-manno-octulosonate cytidylyltransferase
MTDSILIVIPARYASTRLPGKPLLEIAGRPMVQHVWARACEVREHFAGAQVVVATDDGRIEEVVRGFGGEVLLTNPAHPSGTDRLVEVAEKIRAQLYVNLQGDEPLMRPGDIGQLIAGMLAAPEVEVGTLCHALSAEEAQLPQAVKVVRAANGDALYFSRSLIPYPREVGVASYWKHLGIYAYRPEVLRSYGQLARPAIEEAECLEQLRLLYHGVRLRVWEVEESAPGVDTPEDLARVRSLLE